MSITNIRSASRTLAAGFLLALPSQAVTIYQDDFNFGTVETPVFLNGRTPTMTTGGATWTAADTAWTSNGSSLTPVQGNRTAYLPFVPQTGKIYELTAMMSNASTADTTWVSIGFNESATPDVLNNFTSVSTSGIGTVILRQNGNNQWYAGPQVTGSSGGIPIVGFTGNTFYEHKLVLNTMGTNWTMDFYLNGVQKDINGSTTAGSTYTWGTNPTINSMTLTNTTAHTQARYDSFSLTVVPEPSSALLMGLGALALLRRRRA